MKANTNDAKKRFFFNQANQLESNIKTQIIRFEINKLCDNYLNAKNSSNTYKIKKIKNYKIESNKELNKFTSMDIQVENEIITGNFENELDNFSKIDEQVGIFCKNVAQISRMSYNASFLLLIKMKKKFIELKGNKLLLTDENFRKEFSSWIKCSEIENNIFEVYQNILNQEFPLKINENSYEEKYLINLFYDLTLLYFHCHIAFPLVEINFKTEDNFNSRKMIDCINMGKYKNVNFAILPSLISYGSFLEDGKSRVFTYDKNTFKLEETEIDTLNNILFNQNSNIESIKNEYALKVIWKNKNNVKYVDIISNIGTPRRKRYEFALFVYDKNKEKTFSLITKLTHLEIEENMEIVKCELRVDNKAIISSKNIINENLMKFLRYNNIY